MVKHLCGQCSKKFSSLSAYLKHKCSATEHTPAEIEHFQSPSHAATTPIKRKGTIFPDEEILEAIAEARKK